MTLRHALGSLDDFDEAATIYAAKHWTPLSETAIAVSDGDIDSAIEEGMAYLLEVSIASEVIDVWSSWRDGRVPNPGERCEAIIYYAENDAYLQL